MTITTETEGDGHEPYDESLLRALRAGNEEAFVSLIEQYYIDQIKSIGRLTSRLKERDVPTSVRDALLEAFRHWKSHRC